MRSNPFIVKTLDNPKRIMSTPVQPMESSSQTRAVEGWDDIEAAQSACEILLIEGDTIEVIREVLGG